MADLDDRINALYAGPLGDFTASRNALAKTVTGAEAARVRALGKPTVVAWALNQVFWHARKVFDRVLDTGERLRGAQIGALQGKSVDVRAATLAHREAIAAAVREAERLASSSGSHPSPDALTRTLEALSLLPSSPSVPGRLTGELQPAGFEALAGITAAAPPRPAAHHPAKHVVHAPSRGHGAKNEEAARKEDARRQAEAARRLEAEAKEREAAARKRDAEVRKAEAALARAQGAERMAHEAWLRAQKEVDDARQRLTRAKHGD